ncbi:hypothetical protein [Streptomyces sp. NPDC055060]
MPPGPLFTPWPATSHPAEPTDPEKPAEPEEPEEGGRPAPAAGRTRPWAPYDTRYRNRLPGHQHSKQIGGQHSEPHGGQIGASWAGQCAMPGST